MLTGSTRRGFKVSSVLIKRWASVLCAFLLCLLSLIPDRVLPARPERERILFLDDGLLDFDRPQDYPPDSGSDGMFGSLLDYLTVMGFSTKTCTPVSRQRFATA